MSQSLHNAHFLNTPTAFIHLCCCVKSSHLPISINVHVPYFPDYQLCQDNVLATDTFLVAFEDKVLRSSCKYLLRNYLLGFKFIHSPINGKVAKLDRNAGANKKRGTAWCIVRDLLSAGERAIATVAFQA